MAMEIIEWDKDGKPHRKTVPYYYDPLNRFSTPRKYTNINEFLNKQEVRTVQKNWEKYAKRLNNLGDYKNCSKKIFCLSTILYKFDNMIKALTLGRDHSFLDDVLRWPR